MSLFLDTTGNLSANSIAILSSISRSDVSSFCLHPFENIRGLEQSDVIEGEETNSALNKLRLILQDVLVTHLIGEPVQVLALMAWSITTLNSFKYRILRKRRGRRQTDKGNSYQSSLPTLGSTIYFETVSTATGTGIDFSGLISLSEIFRPLFASLVVSPRGVSGGEEQQLHSRWSSGDGQPMSPVLESVTGHRSTGMGDGEGAAAQDVSPRRSGRKRKSKKVSDDVGDYDNVSSLEGSPGGLGLESRRRQVKRHEPSEYDAALPSPGRGVDPVGGSCLSPNEQFSTSTGEALLTGNRAVRKRTQPPQRHLQTQTNWKEGTDTGRAAPPRPPTHPAHSLYRPDSFNQRLTDDLSNDSFMSRLSQGIEETAMSQSSIATLADLAEKMSSPQPHRQQQPGPFRHIFQTCEEGATHRGRGTEGESDTDLDVDVGLSQSQSHSQGGLGSAAHSLSAYPPLSQISNLSSSFGDESILPTSAPVSKNGKALHRKPSFLPAGAPYDGGGFKFMSGLSQD